MQGMCLRPFPRLEFCNRFGGMRDEVPSACYIIHETVKYVLIDRSDSESHELKLMNQ